MSDKNLICQAIRELHLLSFFYDNAVRVVEPHQLGINKAQNVALSAYWVSGYSESGDTANRWREFIIEEMSNARILDETFSGPRPGYKKAPNGMFPGKAICEL